MIQATRKGPHYDCAHQSPPFHWRAVLLFTGAVAAITVGSVTAKNITGLTNAQFNQRATQITKLVDSCRHQIEQLQLRLFPMNQ